MLSKKVLKFMCLCAYCQMRLEDSLKREVVNAAEDKIKVVAHGDIEKGREVLRDIKKRIEDKGYTISTVERMRLKLPILTDYFNCVVNTINALVPDNVPWTPSVVVLSMLQEYTLKGHKLFSDINFDEQLERFELHIESQFVFNMKVAGEVVKKLERMK